MKRALSLVLAAALVLGSIPAGFAATSTAGETLKGYGVVAGDTNGSLNEDKTITRAEMMTVLARLLGKYEEASKYSIPSTSKDVAGHWNANVIAFAEKEGWTAGLGNGIFDPQGTVTLQQAATFMLKALGYTVTDFSKVVEEATKLGLLKDVVAKDATAKVLRSDVFTAALNTLNTPAKDTTVKLGEKLGYMKPVVVVETLDVKSAVALSSKVVEVTLNTAVKTVDAKAFAVKDAAGAAVAVTAAELAAYDADGKTVVLTLEKDTTAGTLYTLTAAAKSVTFGGKAADTTKPTVTSVTSTDYNKVEIVFSEAVKLGGTIELAKMYNDKAALAITATTLKAKDTVVLTTADQADATLYSAAVKGFTDLSGNKMDDNTALNFVGTAKSTADQEVVKANGLNPEEIIVEFAVNVDPAAIKVENFKVVDTYASGAPTLAVTAARVATTDDTDTAGTALTSTTKGKFVILTVPGVKDATLYKITVSNVGTLYGKALSTTAAKQSTTSVAVAKPATVLLFANSTPVVPSSNTEVVVSFKYKVDKTVAETVANYVATEAYSTTALTVTKAVVQDNGKDVKLTVSAMKPVLYKVTISNIKDIYGNALKTESSYNVVQFAGKDVAAKITTFTATHATSTTLRVVFDQAVAKDATDVSKYTINNGVGYPEKAVINTTVDATGKTVDLTIPKTTVGKAYTLTVKGLANADGVAMATDGVTKTFAGQGIAATKPELVAVMAADNQTMKIYFDRAVTDSSIDGVAWDSSAKQLINNFFTVDAAVDFDPFDDAAGHVAYKDPSNENVLIVRVGTADKLKAAAKDTTLNAFKLTGTAISFADSKNALVFAPIDTAATEIKIDAVMAINTTTVRVYFNQPVYGTLATFADVNATIGATYNTGGTPIALSNPVAVDTTKKVYDFKLASALAGGTYYLNVNPAAKIKTNTILSDSPKSGQGSFVIVNADNTQKAFAGTTTAAADIKSVSVLMTNDKTIVVYYPEAMNTSVTGQNGAASISAKDFDNYTLVNGSDVAVTMNDNTAFDATTDIAKIVYSTTTNTATITLNQTIKTAAGGAFVKISNLTANATQTATVKDGSTVISKQFALNTTAAPKVTLSEASLTNGATEVLTITLAQEAAVAGADLALNNAAGDNNLLSLFTITMPGITTLTAAEITDIKAYDVDDALIADTTVAGKFVKKLVVTITPAGAEGATASSVGSVQIKTGAGLTGINGNAIDTDSKVEFTQ